MLQQITYASIALAVVLFLGFLGHIASNPFVVKASIPITTIIAFLLLALFLYFANITEGK